MWFLYSALITMMLIVVKEIAALICLSFVLLCSVQTDMVPFTHKTYSAGGWRRCHLQRVWGRHGQAEAGWFLHRVSQLHGYPEERHSEHDAVLYPRSRQRGTGDNQDQFSYWICFCGWAEICAGFYFGTKLHCRFHSGIAFRSSCMDI